MSFKSKICFWKVFLASMYYISVLDPKRHYHVKYFASHYYTAHTCSFDVKITTFSRKKSTLPWIQRSQAYKKATTYFLNFRPQFEVFTNFSSSLLFDPLWNTSRIFCRRSSSLISRWAEMAAQFFCECSNSGFGLRAMGWRSLKY